MFIKRLRSRRLNIWWRLYSNKSSKTERTEYIEYGRIPLSFQCVMLPVFVVLCLCTPINCSSMCVYVIDDCVPVSVSRCNWPEYPINLAWEQLKSMTANLNPSCEVRRGLPLIKWMCSYFSTCHLNIKCIRHLLCDKFKFNSHFNSISFV